jgi:hypothetical protein
MRLNFEEGYHPKQKIFTETKGPEETPEPA